METQSHRAMPNIGFRRVRTASINRLRESGANLGLGEQGRDFLASCLLSTIPDDKRRLMGGRRAQLAGLPQGRMETEDMDNVYGVVLGVILVFPWSLVAIMVGGAWWGRVRAFVRVRHPR